MDAVERGRLCVTSLKYAIYAQAVAPPNAHNPRVLLICVAVSDFMHESDENVSCLLSCGDCQIFCLRGVFTNRLLPPGLLPVLVSLLLICVLVQCV